MSKSPQNTKAKRQKLLVIVVAVLVLAIALLGAGIGIATAITNANAAARLDGVLCDAGEVNYLASRYKSVYIQSLKASGVNASDTERFWNSTADGADKSYGELLAEGTRGYVADIIAASRIYLNYARLASSEKEKVRAACDEVVKYKGGGSVASFNEQCARFGFDYNDFLSANEKIYMASVAKDMIYGVGGSGLSSFGEECDKYFEEYVCVKLLFFRKNTKIASDGSIADLTEEERAQRAEAVAAIRQYIANHIAGTEDAISPETFEIYYPKSDGDPRFYDTGYYLHPNAEQTGYFREAYGEVYEKILTMSVGDYAEAEWDVDLDPDTDERGVCFIYRAPLAKGAYTNTENLMFSDFYSDASAVLYSEVVEELSTLVEFTDNYLSLDVVNIPSNHSIYVKSFD
jgi:hypothetical protein